jgi:hypothetical protein
LVGKISLVSRLPQYLTSALPEEAESVAYLMTAILTGAVDVASYTILDSVMSGQSKRRMARREILGFRGNEWTVPGGRDVWLVSLDSCFL